MSWRNREYWKSRRGDLYVEQQQVRRQSRQQTYALQEAWLLSQLNARANMGWCFYLDGYRALAFYGGCELLEVSTDWEPHEDPGSSHWGDTVGVFVKKPNQPWRARFA
jgi:hypothetical protein